MKGENEVQEENTPVSSAVHKASSTPITSTTRPRPSDEESQKRGRRMLDLVLGTLQKFRTSEATDEASAKQRAVQSRLAEQIQKERALLVETVEKEGQERRERKREARRKWAEQVEAEVQETKSQREALFARFLKTQNTETYPLYYLPAKLTSEQDYALQRQLAEYPAPMEVCQRINFDVDDDHDSYDDMSDDDYEIAKNSS